MLDTILKAVTYLLDRLAPSKKDAQVRRRDLCHQLRDLHTSLRAIIDTGNAIGQMSHFGTYEPDDTRQRIERLSELLRRQNANIARAVKQMKSLESVLRIKLPDTAESLAFYLPRKGNVITILAAAADENNFQDVDPISLRPWSYRTDNIDAVVEHLATQTLTGPERRRGEMFLRYSSDIFAAIDKATEDLRGHIDKLCAPEDLI